MPSVSAKKRSRVSPGSEGPETGTTKKKKRVYRKLHKTPSIKSFLCSKSRLTKDSAVARTQVSNDSFLITNSPTSCPPAAVVDDLHVSSEDNQTDCRLEPSAANFVGNGGEDCQQPAIDNVTRKEKQQAGEACIIAAHTILLLFERISKLGNSLDKVLAELKTMSATAERNMVPSSSDTAQILPSAAHSRDKQGALTPITKSIGKVAQAKLYLTWNSQAVLLNIPRADGHLWSTKEKIAKALSQLLSTKVRCPDIKGYHFLLSSPHYKRLFLSLASQKLTMLILRASAAFKSYNIWTQRAFIQRGNTLAFKLKCNNNSKTSNQVVNYSLQELLSSTPKRGVLAPSRGQMKETQPPELNPDCHGRSSCLLMNTSVVSPPRLQFQEESQESTRSLRI